MGEKEGERGNLSRVWFWFCSGCMDTHLKESEKRRLKMEMKKEMVMKKKPVFEWTCFFLLVWKTNNNLPLCLDKTKQTKPQYPANKRFFCWQFSALKRQI